MNLFTLAQKGWSDAEAFIDSLIQKAAKSPVTAALIAAGEADLKQQASLAIGLLGTGFAPAATVLAGATETALDAAYAQYIGPAAPLASAASHDVIDKVRDAAIYQANLWSLKAKAALAPPAPVVQPQPQPQPQVQPQTQDAAGNGQPGS